MQRRSFSLTGIFTLAAWGMAKGGDEAGLAIMSRQHRGKRWFCLKLDLSRSLLQLFQSGDDGKPLRSFAELERYVTRRARRVVAAMNAGMFEQDGSPVGWCVAEGKMVQGPNQREGTGNFFLKPNGVFAVQQGKALVLETGSAVKTLDRATLITQSGPMLVTTGQLHPAFRENSTNRHVRNAVGVDADGLVWLAISADPVNFHESATVFRDEFGCPDALFLDGVVSRLHAPRLGHRGGDAELGPLLAVTEAVV